MKPDITPEERLQHFLRNIEKGLPIENDMTTEEKLAHCIHVLELLCKPANKCTIKELEELDGVGSEDEMAYNCLMDIGAKPPWDMPIYAKTAHFNDGPDFDEEE